MDLSDIGEISNNGTLKGLQQGAGKVVVSENKLDINNTVKREFEVVLPYRIEMKIK